MKMVKTKTGSAKRWNLYTHIHVFSVFICGFHKSLVVNCFFLYRTFQDPNPAKFQGSSEYFNVFLGCEETFFLISVGESELKMVF